MLSKFSNKGDVPVIGTCACADVAKSAGKIAAQSGAKSLRRGLELALFFMSGLESDGRNQKCQSRGEKPMGICYSFVMSGRVPQFSKARTCMTGTVNYSGSSVALKKAAGPGIAKDERASSGRQRPGTFSGAAKSPVSLRRKSRSRCHGPVRRRLNSLMPQSRSLSREFHRSRRCPKPVVVASGCCRRRCDGTCRRFCLFL